MLHSEKTPTGIIYLFMRLMIPTQKRKKMDKNAIKSYLVGYHGEERYRIWVKKDHKVMLSRDVMFQERRGICDSYTELSMQDRIESNQGKNEEQHIEINTVEPRYCEHSL